MLNRWCLMLKDLLKSAYQVINWLWLIYSEKTVSSCDARSEWMAASFEGDKQQEKAIILDI